MKIETDFLKRALNLVRSPLTPVGRRNAFAHHKRLTRAAASSAGMAVSKILQLSVSIITVPLMLTYLGQEAYGLTMAIVSFSMLFFIDMGISEGVKLRLIECFACDDQTASKAYMSTGFLGLLLFSFILGGTLALLFPFIEWKSLFSLSENTPVSEKTLLLTVALSMMIVVILIPLKLIKELLTAIQRGYVFSLFVSIGIVCSLLAIYVAVRLDLGIIGVIFGLQGSLVFAYIAMWIFMLFDKFSWVLPRWKAVSMWAFTRMWRDSLLMFFMSVGFLIINGTDVFIVNHYLGQIDAATYSVSIRFFVYVEVLISFVLYPLWPALGEAILKGETQWVIKVSRQLLFCAIGFGAIFLLVVIGFGRPIIAFWTRDMIQPSLQLHLLFGIYYGIRIITAVYVTLLRAHGRIRLQSLAQCCEAILHLGLCIFLVQRMGIIGMVIGGIISIGVTQAWMLPLEYRKVFKFYCREGARL